MALIDFDYLNEISDGDADYICDLLDIFMDTVPPGIDALQNLIRQGEDWDAIYKQSHTLKSSLGIVKIGDMLQLMADIELNAMKTKDLDKAEADLDVIVNTFKDAKPLLLQEREKYQEKRARK